MGMKICKGCGENKPLEQFWKAKQNIDGRYGKCSACRMKEIVAKGVLQSVQHRYSIYKTSSHRRKSRSSLEFSITVEQFDTITKQPCEYCGGFSPNKDFCGIDRVDDTKGYVLGNCVPCCSICNFMKRDLTQEDFLKHIAKIHSKSFLL